MINIKYGFVAKTVMKIVDQRDNMGRHVIDFFTSRIKYENVLDIGAGNGDDLMIAKKNNKSANLYAIENYPPCIENLSNKNIKCFTINLETERFPFDDKKMDLIIGNQIFEHTKELFWIFHEICRVIKPGGYFIVGVPNLASFHNRVLLLLGKQPSCIYPESAHVRGFTKDGLKRFAEMGGLKLISFKGSNFYPFPPGVARFLSKVFPNLSVGMFLLLKKDGEYKDEYLKFISKNELATNFFTGK